MSERPDSGSTEPTPRWVKIGAIVAGAVIVLFVVLLIAGGDHGPGRHSAPAAQAVR